MESNYKVSVNHETVIAIVVTHLFRLVQLSIACGHNYMVGMLALVILPVAS